MVLDKGRIYVNVNLNINILFVIKACIVYEVFIKVTFVNLSLFIVCTRGRIRTLCRVTAAEMVSLDAVSFLSRISVHTVTVILVYI